MTVINMGSKRQRDPEEKAEKVEVMNRPDALYNMETIMYSQIAILISKKNSPEGLSNDEWKRLNDLFKMMKGLTDIELSGTKKSILEGLTDDEILHLVEQAKKAMVNE